MFDNQSIDIPCPGCGHKTRKTIAWLKSHRHYTCRCGSRIDLDTKKFVGPLKLAEDQIARAFRNTKLNLTIKL
jgi:DNA-directed RNA polymerase subunit RPC12/RpoP